MPGSIIGPLAGPVQPRAAAASPFSRLVGVCVAAGLGECILPVMPVDAVTRPALAHNRGKIPGLYRGSEGWCGMPAWTRHVATPADHELWSCWPGAGLCIRTGKLPALDIDVEHLGLAQDLDELVRRRIGPGVLVRTRGTSPRRALLFRVDEVVSKRRMVFRLPGDARDHAVELLGEGQQLVLAGRHPSGEQYGIAAPGLSGRTFEDIPSLTLDGLDALWVEIRSAIEAAGGVIVQAGKSSGAGRREDGPFDPYRAVMRAVARRRAEWVPQVLDVAAGPPEQEWRITGVALGRDDQVDEDLVVYPDGVFDHGTERAHDPISLIAEFGSVGADGEIEFGGCPEYGLLNGQPYAVTGEFSSKVRRPSKVEAVIWLCRQLDGLQIPAGTTIDAAMPSLAATVGLDWNELEAEHARSVFDALDAAGNVVEMKKPEAWTRDELRRNARRVAAMRALDPNRADRLQMAWDITGAAREGELDAILETEGARVREMPLEPAPTLNAVPPLPLNIRRVKGPIDPRSIPTRRHVIFPRCPRGDVLLTAAEPGASKSTLALFDALVIASGDESILRGENGASPERLHRPGAAIVYDAEDPIDEMSRRLAAAQQHYRLPDLKHEIVLWSGAGSGALKVARRNSNAGALVIADGAGLLRRMIQETGAVYVVVGPFAGLADGMNENDAADCNAVMQILADIAAQTGVCINLIHHTSKKQGGDAGDMNAARGSSAIAARARSMVTLNALSQADADRFGVARSGHFGMTYAKVSHGPRLEAPIIFQRISAPVGNGRGLDGDPRQAFELSAQDLLDAGGDQAPVLRVVAVASAQTREAAQAQRQAEATDAVAQIVADVVGKESCAPLSDAWETIGAKLRERGLIRGKGRNAVVDCLTEALFGEGRFADRDGQLVRVKLEKAGPRKTDPLMLVVDTIPTSLSHGAQTSLSALSENANRQDLQD